jgi:hypothetical protein
MNNFLWDDNSDLLEKMAEICASISLLNDDMNIDTQNEIKKMLHSVSPLKSEPVDCVLWVKNEKVHANDYNPNSVAPPEMELLKTSICVSTPITLWISFFPTLILVPFIFSALLNLQKDKWKTYADCIGH